MSLSVEKCLTTDTQAVTIGDAKLSEQDNDFIGNPSSLDHDDLEDMDDALENDEDENIDDLDAELEDPIHLTQEVNSDPSSNKLFKEDPSLDRRIIEGMLKDRSQFLQDMHAEGYSNTAVLRRAAELGLSEALIRQVKGVAADLAGERPGRRPAPSSLGARSCLSCDRIFLSSGPGNRLCMRCRGGDAGLAQL